MLSLISRVLTVANARCSYVGCNRRRHVGPCNVEHGHEHSHDHAHAHVAPVVTIVPPASTMRIKTTRTHDEDLAIAI